MQIPRTLIVATALVVHWVPVGAHAIHSRKAANVTCDYLIVGAGPAGLTLANRLTEDSSVSVCVIEAGTFPEDVVGNITQVPEYDYIFETGLDNVDAMEWGFETTPQPGLTGESYPYYRGKALGGSTAINYMAYAHSSKGTFQLWADTVGDQSWTYDNIVQYYRKSVNFNPPDNDSRLANATPQYNVADTSTGGPLDVSYSNYAQSWSTWVAEGLEAIGIEKTDAFISGNLNGSSWQLQTIRSATGFRASAEAAFLRPYLNRTNLILYEETFGNRVIFNDNKVATGVEVTTASNRTYTISAAREVIISAGAFQSPQLLQVSGIGPANLLKQFGIAVVADRPGVGQGLTDQICIGISYQVNVRTSAQLAVGDNLQTAIDEFNNFGTGPLSSAGGDYVGLEKVPEDLRSNFSTETQQVLSQLPADWPELQYLVLPSAAGNTDSAIAGANYATLLAVLLAPTSYGNVSIGSASTKDAPIINPNWFTSQSDRELLIAGFKRARQALASDAMKPVLIGEEFYPGSSVQTDEEILEFLTEAASSMSHVTSSNRMGTEDDEYAVVDSHGKVYGVSNLRVVDASIFPFLPPGPAPQAQVYMVAEKIADDIKNGN